MVFVNLQTPLRIDKTAILCQDPKHKSNLPEAEWRMKMHLSDKRGKQILFVMLAAMAINAMFTLYSGASLKVVCVTTFAIIPLACVLIANLAQRRSAGHVTTTAQLAREMIGYHVSVNNPERLVLWSRGTHTRFATAEEVIVRTDDVPNGIAYGVVDRTFDEGLEMLTLETFDDDALGRRWHAQLRERAADDDSLELAATVRYRQGRTGTLDRLGQYQST